jgi:hypothetical protein
VPKTTGLVGVGVAMILTAKRESDQQTAPIARAHVDVWEKSLAFRISLQQITDKFNQFPVLPETLQTSDLPKFQNNELKSELGSLLQETSSLLLMQTGKEDDEEEAYDHVPDWDELVEVQDSLTEDWKAVINKWHARTHFGSEKKKANLKVFNQTIWDQVSEQRE